MKHSSAKTASAKPELANPASFRKTGARALIRAFALALIGLGALLLPTLGSAQAVQTWQELVRYTAPATSGCFTATYPDTQWQQVLCVSSQPEPTGSPVPVPVVAPGQIQAEQAAAGLSARLLRSPALPQAALPQTAESSSGSISSVEGSLLNITGVSDIIDSAYGENGYSLQTNINFFTLTDSSSLCASGACLGWEQFVYQDYGLSNGYFAIWYMLVGTSSCPSAWPMAQLVGNVCYFSAGEWIPAQSIVGLSNQVSLSGQMVNGLDKMVLATGGNAYAVVNGSVFSELSQPQVWQDAEFNIYGVGGASQVSFNTGSTLTVRTRIDDGTTNAPLCNTNNYTGEWSNLTPNSPCCTYAGGEPSIAFVESTGTGQAATCASLGNNAITPANTTPAGGTISPSSTLYVPAGVVSTFTVTPNTGYQIASVTGCNGTLNGNVFATAPATANCTVSAAFAQVPTYTVTASAGTGGSISPSNTVLVPSGTTKTFTLTPAAGYAVASVGGTCGGTLSGNTYTTNAITANCSVTAAFVAQAAQGYVITVSTGAGGTISPSGYITVNPGTTQIFTLTPNPGYGYPQVGGTCLNSGASSYTWLDGNTFSIGSLAGSCTLVAGFMATPYTVTASAGAGGTIFPSGTGTKPLGVTPIYTITPNAGHTISSVGAPAEERSTGTSTQSIRSRPVVPLPSHSNEMT